jgi:hypothetical protein
MSFSTATGDYTQNRKVAGEEMFAKTTVRWRAESGIVAWYTSPIMVKSEEPFSGSEETLDELLHRVSNAREELLSIERSLERLKGDVP